MNKKQCCFIWRENATPTRPLPDSSSLKFLIHLINYVKRTESERVSNI